MSSYDASLMRHAPERFQDQVAGLRDFYNFGFSITSKTAGHSRV